MKSFYSKWKGRLGQVVKELECHTEELQLNPICTKKLSGEGCKITQGLQIPPWRRWREQVGVASTSEAEMLWTESAI